MPPDTNLRLEQRLVLAAWGCHILGYSSNRAMLEDLREVEEGYDSAGRSYLVQRILSRGSKCLVKPETLEQYDANVRRHLAYFNQHRQESLTLRYFQHLSLLVTELFLDRRFNHPHVLRKELNDFLSEQNRRRAVTEPDDRGFSDGDLNKLAYWMATGSGKTILLHFHYRQFLHYNHEPLDNILLVTPDESLSQQHLENMEAAGIPCARFTLEDSGFEAVRKNTVRVIEITKLVQEKKGSGLSVPVEAFEGRNLIFVDEGHRGASTEAGRWIGHRDKLAENGFTFEYSATFGQAMTAAGNDEITREYGKAILFDYSYKYFYGDGFGKDFELLNLRDETNDEQTQMLLLANLLAFYEQKRAFQTRSDAMLRYHLADPLWIFVGSTVNKSKNDKQARESDVLTVVKFLDSVLENKRRWVPKAIEKILEGKSGIEDDGGSDVFVSRFKDLKAWTRDGETICRDILNRVFGSPGEGRLHVGDIKGMTGELGLKVSGADDYFGLVYIGDTAAFKRLIGERCPEIEVDEDQLAEGLFENIKKPESRINILIGAKKFMQGWDSWRVTNMGLLNIGRSEGTEIIQLFGRGVRLKGLNRSLKRSSALPPPHPAGIELLERLNIFAVRANYMTQFRDYLEREGIEPLGSVELKLPIKRNDEFLKKGLVAPRLPSESQFAKSERMLLECDQASKVVLDASVKVERVGSNEGAFLTANYVGGTQRWLPHGQFPLLDWERLYLEMLQFKEERGFHNLVIRPEDPRQILEANDPKLYGVICDEGLLNPKRAEEIGQLQALMAAVLKKYVETFYRKRQQRWDSSRMIYAPLKRDDRNFQDYIVKVPRSNPELVKAIRDIIAEGKRIYKEICAELPGVCLDRHLYQPLLTQRRSQVTCVPPVLKESELRFVEDLLEFCRSKPEVLKNRELFLLRNLSRGKGIGFFEENGFYPDFIFWIVEGKKQRLVFIEPHGMLNEDPPSINAKVNLHLRLKAEAEAALRRSKVKDIELDSFVISFTPYDDLRKRLCEDGKPWSKDKFASAHILFFDDTDRRTYLEQLVTG